MTDLDLRAGLGGIPTNVVGRLVGHHQISNALDRYTHDASAHADLRV